MITSPCNTLFTYFDKWVRLVILIKVRLMRISLGSMFRNIIYSIGHKKVCNLYFKVWKF